MIFHEVLVALWLFGELRCDALALAAAATRSNNAIRFRAFTASRAVRSRGTAQHVMFHLSAAQSKSIEISPEPDNPFQPENAPALLVDRSLPGPSRLHMVAFRPRWPITATLFAQDISVPCVLC